MPNWDWHLALEVGHYVILPIAYSLGRKLFKSFESDLIQNVMVKVDERFKEHEKCDDRIKDRLDSIEALLLNRRRTDIGSRSPRRGPA